MTMPKIVPALSVGPEFAVTVKLANNLLLARRKALGMNAPELAKAVGIGYAIRQQSFSLESDQSGLKPRR